MRIFFLYPATDLSASPAPFSVDVSEIRFERNILRSHTFSLVIQDEDLRKKAAGELLEHGVECQREGDVLNLGNLNGYRLGTLNFEPETLDVRIRTADVPKPLDPGKVEPMPQMIDRLVREIIVKETQPGGLLWRISAST